MLLNPAAVTAIRGHDIEIRDGKWVYRDDGSLVSDGWRGRPCGKCGEYQTPEGHDPCLGTLPGVRNACCGHGIEAEAYVQLVNGDRVEGKEALLLATELSKEPRDG